MVVVVPLGAIVVFFVVGGWIVVVPEINWRVIIDACTF